MTQASLQGDVPAHTHGRKATWFELFFDLVFVVAVAQLSGAFAHHYDGAGAGVFAFGFLAMWWCWLGHTFHATRFDADTSAQRWLGVAQILAVVWIGYGASDLGGERAWVFASGIAVFKVLLALAYGLSWRWRGAHGLIRSYISLYLVQGALWAASVAMAPEWRWALWALAFALDLASPWWVARYTHQVPPHPEHLPERFGLFTIILLGEGMAASVHALDHGPALTAQALIAALGGALLSFLVWIGYFERSRGHQEREVDSAGAGRNLRLWAYAHVPLYLGIASQAAGTVYLAGQPVINTATQLLFAAGITLVMIGLSLLGAASRGPLNGATNRRTGASIAVAVTFFLLMVFIHAAHIAYLYFASACVFALQLKLTKRMDAPH